MASKLVTVRPRYPAAFLAASLLFLLLDAAAWKNDWSIRFLDRYTPLGPTDSLMTVKARLLPRDAPAPLVLLMGSSQVREGLDCAAFEASLPGRLCRNLASIGGTPLDALYLRERIDPRAGKRTLVFGVFPWMLHQPPKTFFTDVDTLRCLTAGDAWRRMSWSQHREVLYGLLTTLSETLRNRKALDPLYGVVSRHPLEALRLELPAPDTRLGAPLGERLRRPEEELEEGLARGVVESSQSTFTATQEAALDQLIARENARGDRPVIVDFPTRPGYERRLSPGATAHYSRFLDRLRLRSDVVFVGTGDLQPLTTADFNDFTHLSSQGRDKVSRRLGEILAGLPP